MLELLSDLSFWRPCARCHRLRELMYSSTLLYLENAGFFFFKFVPILSLMLFMSPLLHRFRPWKEGCNKDIQLGLNISKSLTVFTISIEYLCVNYNLLLRRAFPSKSWGCTDLWVSNMSLEIILLLCSLNRIIVVGFYLSP